MAMAMGMAKDHCAPKELVSIKTRRCPLTLWVTELEEANLYTKTIEHQPSKTDICW